MGAHTLLEGNVASCENKSIHGLLADLNAKVDRIEALLPPPLLLPKMRPLGCAGDARTRVAHGLSDRLTD